MDRFTAQRWMQSLKAVLKSNVLFDVRWSICTFDLFPTVKIRHWLGAHLTNNILQWIVIYSLLLMAIGIEIQMRSWPTFLLYQNTSVSLLPLKRKVYIVNHIQPASNLSRLGLDCSPISFSLHCQWHYSFINDLYQLLSQLFCERFCVAVVCQARNTQWRHFWAADLNIWCF